MIPNTNVNVFVRTEPRRSYDPTGGSVVVNPIAPDVGRMLMSKTTRISPTPE
jgi:hypothetical protein